MEVDYNNIIKKFKYNRNKEIFAKIKYVIEEFCRDKKLIIYGGLAMNKYLKSVGHEGIYDEYENIDFDVYSMNYLEDSETLAKKIYELDIPYIKIHSGMKSTTRKIFLSSLTLSVIDLNEINAEKYEKLNPVRFEDDGLYYIRVDALYEDQIKNLVTNLFVDYHRIQKNSKRLNYLFNYFPVIPKKNESYYSFNEKTPKINEEMYLKDLIWAGDFVFNYYYSEEFKGNPTFYYDGDDLTEWENYQIEGVTIFYDAKYEEKKIRIAPPALLLYFYFKKKIAENTDKYDFQIYFLTQNGFPFPNYKEVNLYFPKNIIKETQTYINTIYIK